MLGESRTAQHESLEPPLPCLARRARPFRAALPGELPAAVGDADCRASLDLFAGQLAGGALGGDEGVIAPQDHPGGVAVPSSLPRASLGFRSGHDPLPGAGGFRRLVPAFRHNDAARQANPPVAARLEVASRHHAHSSIP